MVLAVVADARHYCGLPSLDLCQTDYYYYFSILIAEGKIPSDEPTVLPLVPVVSRDEKRRFGFSTPQASKKFRGNGTSMVTLQEQDLDEPLV